ncbi:hypothetical protein LTR28_005437 [Elasticomyces elasticus]|nr:hypothetical protein LTR28_005437 [Elasticomyces elasticus]
MAHIILTGATGTAGSAVLAYALASPSVSRISILSRRPVKLAENEPKATVLIHKDYTSYPPELLRQLGGATACIWVQGISSIGMREDEYTEITVAYPLAAVKAFAALADAKAEKEEGPAKMNFVYVSGEGADQARARQMFGRVKGRAERELQELMGTNPALRVYSARPAYIDPEREWLAEKEPTWVDRTAGFVAPVFRTLMPSAVIPTHKLAEALVQLAVGDGQPVEAGVGVEHDGRVLRNTALRRMAGI